MLLKCPSCNTEYDCEPGKYQCACGVKFMLKPDGDVFVVSEANGENRDNMAFPDRMSSGETPDDMTIPMPGLRDRKTPGRFNAGEMILGRYMALSELGQGSMGAVCKCFDETAGTVVALYALPPDLSQNAREMDGLKEMFRRICKLCHPNIAACNALEWDKSTGNYYLITECVEGEDLRRWAERLRGEGGLTLGTAIPVIRQLAAALDYAHGEKIVHGDLKPDNIMVDRTGLVKVPDFGLAAHIRAGMTRMNMAYSGTTGPTPCMAPEQWNGNPPGPATDQFALAAMTFEMLAGRPPFDGSDAEALRQAVLTREPPPIASLPEHAQAAISKALSKDPANRFGTCSAFVDALEGKAGESSAAPVSGRIPQGNDASVSGPESPQSMDRRDASAQPLREPPAQEIPVRKKKRGKKVFGILFALVVVAAVILFAFYKRNEIPGLSRLDLGFGRTSDDSSGDASDPVFDEITAEIAHSDSVPTSEGEQPGDASGNISDEKKIIPLSDSVSLEMVKDEAGSFEMSKKDGENKPEEVPHQATLTRDFYIGRTEVTQAQWKAMMGNNPSGFKGDDLPVEGVTWNEAVEFCEKLNSTGKAPGEWIFSLPTETQWEFAARGGNKSKGYKYSGSDDIDEVAWYWRNSGDTNDSGASWSEATLKNLHCKPHPVGLKKPNELGLYDMSGNVWEWCLDDWKDRSDKLTAEFTRGGDRGGPDRASRGGSWRDGWRSEYRYHSEPAPRRRGDTGFRVVLVPAAGYGADNESKPAPPPQAKLGEYDSEAALTGCRLFLLSHLS